MDYYRRAIGKTSSFSDQSHKRLCAQAVDSSVKKPMLAKEMMFFSTCKMKPQQWTGVLSQSHR
jgi:hypothetical protein